ncbi:MAG: hypothetical protein KatS3mg014_2429 [Actinomycetota bacterium]|nr:MAG: hypothetical protein KatS3mg014_2429 [Actinomycetota bacterium]
MCGEALHRTRALRRPVTNLNLLVPRHAVEATLDVRLTVTPLGKVRLF